MITSPIKHTRCFCDPELDPKPLIACRDYKSPLSDLEIQYECCYCYSILKKAPLLMKANHWRRQFTIRHFIACKGVGNFCYVLTKCDAFCVPKVSNPCWRWKHFQWAKILIWEQSYMGLSVKLVTCTWNVYQAYLWDSFKVFAWWHRKCETKSDTLRKHCPSNTKVKCMTLAFRNKKIVNKSFSTKGK